MKINKFNQLISKNGKIFLICHVQRIGSFMLITLLSLLIVTESVGYIVYRSYCPMTHTTSTDFFSYTCCCQSTDGMDKNGKGCCDVSIEHIGNQPDGFSSSTAPALTATAIEIPSFPSSPQFVISFPTEARILPKEYYIPPPLVTSSKDLLIKIETFRI